MTLYWITFLSFQDVANAKYANEVSRIYLQSTESATISSFLLVELWGMAKQESKELDSLVTAHANADGLRLPAIQVADRPPDCNFPASDPLSQDRTAGIRGSREHVALLPPQIIYDTVATAPNSPTEPGPSPAANRSDFRSFSWSTHHLESRSTSVTPSGSLLNVNKPIELRESTLTVNYPDTGGTCLSLLSFIYILFNVVV